MLQLLQLLLQQRLHRIQQLKPLLSQQLRHPLQVVQTILLASGFIIITTYNNNNPDEAPDL